MGKNKKAMPRHKHDRAARPSVVPTVKTSENYARVEAFFERLKVNPELSREIPKDLLAIVHSLKHRYIRNDGGTDYGECLFCLATSPVVGKRQNINHNDDCFGMKLLEAAGEL